MNAKKTIRKIIFVTVWLCIGAGMFTLLMAAITRKDNGHCAAYTIRISGVEKNYFIDEKDVEVLLKKAAGGPIKGQPLTSLNLHNMEEALERNTWISDAELYVDNQDVLHVRIVEEEPVARIFTSTGNSFYIDKTGKKLPLSDKISARVPVFTGYPELKKMNKADSALLTKVTAAANYIIADPFWMAQVAQMNITPERNFEMIPVVGNHQVKMGAGDQIDRQFGRLMIFYKQVLSKTGFDRFKVIDVQYKGQVVASKTAGNTKVDSVQLRRNVELLLQQSRQAENDTVARLLPVAAIPLEADAPDETPMVESPEKPTTLPTNTNPVPLKSPVPADRKEQPKPVKQNKPSSKQPKAVMPPKGEDPDNGYN